MELKYSQNAERTQSLSIDGKDIGRAYKLEFSADISRNDTAVIYFHAQETEIVTQLESLFIVVGDRKFCVVEVVK